MGSIPTGRVLEIDTKTGASREAVPAREGHAAIGLKYDRRGQRLFVSGGPTGKAFVYDARNGRELAALQLTPAGTPTFINDVVLTRRVAYFTDSRAARDLRRGARPLGRQADRAGRLPAERWVRPQRDRGGARRPGAAGRAELRRGCCGESTRRRARTGPSTSGGARSPTATGCCCSAGGRCSWCRTASTRSRWSSSAEGSPPAASSALIRDSDFDVPTTVARKRGSLYLPNARFGTPPTPETEYWVTRVGKR